MPRSWSITNAAGDERGTGENLTRADAVAVGQEVQARTGEPVYVQPADATWTPSTPTGGGR